MRPIKKKLVVEVVYWDCGHPDHQHKSEKMAAECIKKRERSAKRAPHVEWSDENRKKIIQMNESGFSLEEIRKEFGWSSKDSARSFLKDSLSRKKMEDFCKSFVGPI